MNSLQKRNLLITGANRGIGHGIVEKLLSDSTPYNIIFTSRDEAAGQKVLEAFKAKYPKSSSNLTHHQLDVTDNKGIENLASWYEKSFGKLDVFVNNAGIAKGDSTEEKKLTIRTNYFSVLAMNERFIPLLSDDAKILNISSIMGQLSGQDETLRKILDNEKLTEEELNETAENILNVSQGANSPMGIYCASKALLNAYVRRFLPGKVKAGQQVYAVHPGWVKTDMGGAEAPLSIEESASDIVKLTNSPFKVDEKLNAKLVYKNEVIDW